MGMLEDHKIALKLLLTKTMAYCEVLFSDNLFDVRRKYNMHPSTVEDIVSFAVNARGRMDRTVCGQNGILCGRYGPAQHTTR